MTVKKIHETNADVTILGNPCYAILPR